MSPGKLTEFANVDSVGYRCFNGQLKLKMNGGKFAQLSQISFILPFILQTSFTRYVQNPSRKLTISENMHRVLTNVSILFNHSTPISSIVLSFIVILSIDCYFYP